MVLNQSGREMAGHWGPFGGGMKVVSVPSGSGRPPFLSPMAEGRGQGRKLHTVCGHGML